MAKEIEEAIDGVVIGDKLVDVKDITPSTYFEYVKNMKKKFDFDETALIIDNALTMIKKCKITGQTEMAKEIAHQANLALRELNAAKKGFDIFVNREDIERYIDKIENKSVKIIEINKYIREIPDDVMDKLEQAIEIFDQLYIMFTDYTMKETKKVAKERRDKDPIVFGAFLDKDEEDSKKRPYVENRLFFIADWVEEKCDLTLEQIVRDVKDKEGKDITYKVITPTDEEAIKKYLKSFSEPIENLEPVSIFEKAKKAVKKATTRKRTSKKKSEE